MLDLKKNKEISIALRLDSVLHKKIKTFMRKHKVKNKSQTIRSILSWSFENGLDKKD